MVKLADRACVQLKRKGNRKLLPAPCLGAGRYIITAQRGLHKSIQCCHFRPTQLTSVFHKKKEVVFCRTGHQCPASCTQRYSSLATNLRSLSLFPNVRTSHVEGLSVTLQMVHCAPAWRRYRGRQMVMSCHITQSVYFNFLWKLPILLSLVVFCRKGSKAQTQSWM